MQKQRLCRFIIIEKKTCFLPHFLSFFFFSMGRNGFWCPYCQKHWGKPFEHLSDDKKRSKCMQQLRAEGTTPEAVVDWCKDAARRWYTLAPSVTEINRLGLDISTLLYAGIPVPRELLRDYTGPTPVGGWRWCPTPKPEATPEAMPEPGQAATSTEPEQPTAESTSSPKRLRSVKKSKPSAEGAASKTRRLSVIKMQTRERKRALSRSSHAPAENIVNQAPVTPPSTPDRDGVTPKDELPEDSESKPRPFRSPLATVALRSRDFYYKQNPFSRFK